MCLLLRVLTYFTSNGYEKIRACLAAKIKHAIDTCSSRYVIIRPMSINDPDGDELTNADVLPRQAKKTMFFGESVGKRIYDVLRGEGRKLGEGESVRNM